MFTHRDVTITISGTREVVEVQFQELVVQRNVFGRKAFRVSSGRTGWRAHYIHVYIRRMRKAAIHTTNQIPPMSRVDEFAAERYYYTCGVNIRIRGACTTARRYDFQHGKITSRLGEGHAERSTRLGIIFYFIFFFFKRNTVSEIIIRIEKTHSNGTVWSNGIGRGPCLRNTF